MSPQVILIVHGAGAPKYVGPFPGRNTAKEYRDKHYPHVYCEIQELTAPSQEVKRASR